jgi:hypothetical protein
MSAATTTRRKRSKEPAPEQVLRFFEDVNPKNRRPLKQSKDITVKRFGERVNIPDQIEDFRLPTKLILAAPPKSSDLYKCVRGFIPGETSERYFHKVVSCGKENCTTCGADYSVIHNRRIDRAFPKILQLSSVGYLVVTVPDYLRDAFLDKQVLNDFRNFIRRKLKRDYNTRGLIRWHWCGEDETTWKPHLNILMEGKYWPKEKLEAFRNACAVWFTKNFNLSTPAAGNIYYAYVNPATFKDYHNKKTGEIIPGPLAAKIKIKHWIKYVLRATAKKVKDHRILDVLYKYKNTGYFGKFEKVIKERSAASAILAGCDPETGEVIKWGQRINPSVFYNEYKRHSKEVVQHTIRPAKVLKKVRVSCLHKHNLPALIHYGLYITEKIDLIPAGVQLALHDLNSIFANEQPPPI